MEQHARPRSRRLGLGVAPSVDFRPDSFRESSKSGRAARVDPNLAGGVTALSTASLLDERSPRRGSSLLWSSRPSPHSSAMTHGTRCRAVPSPEHPAPGIDTTHRALVTSFVRQRNADVRSVAQRCPHLPGPRFDSRSLSASVTRPQTQHTSRSSPAPRRQRASSGFPQSPWSRRRSSPLLLHIRVIETPNHYWHYEASGAAVRCSASNMTDKRAIPHAVATCSKTRANVVASSCQVQHIQERPTFRTQLERRTPGEHS